MVAACFTVWPQCVCGFQTSRNNNNLPVCAKHRYVVLNAKHKYTNKSHLAVNMSLSPLQYTLVLLHFYSTFTLTSTTNTDKFPSLLYNYSDTSLRLASGRNYADGCGWLTLNSPLHIIYLKSHIKRYIMTVLLYHTSRSKITLNSTLLQLNLDAKQLTFADSPKQST